MPNFIDLPPCAKQWAEQDVNLYNKLPYYLAKNQVRYVQNFAVWSKLLGKLKWTPKMGTTLKGVRKEPSPILRGEFLPNTIQNTPKKDTIELREMAETAVLYQHRVESQHLHFLPDFQDFMENVDATNEDISSKLTFLPDLFYRSSIWHGSPNLFLCGAAQPLVTDAPHWTPTTGISLIKSTAVAGQPNQGLGYMVQALSKVQGSLSIKNLDRAFQALFNDLNGTPYTGDLLADGTDGSFLAQKFVLLCGNEVWANFKYDPYLLDNKPLDLNIITAGFKGSLGGQITTKVERYEMRLDANGVNQAPETQELNPNAYNYGETIPNPSYVSAPYAVAWLIGADSYKAITPGPPPAPFSGGGMSMEKLNAMDWNGKVRLTRDIMVKCLDEAGNTILDTNKYGEYGQLISSVSMGILPVRRRNILPIIYARSRVSVNN